MKLSSIKRRRPRIVMHRGSTFAGWTFEQELSHTQTDYCPSTIAIAERNKAIDARRDARIKASKTRATAQKGR